MNQKSTFHVVTVGWGHVLIRGLWDPIEARSEHRFSHVMHPRYTRGDFPNGAPPAGIHLFRAGRKDSIKEHDVGLLASLEREGVPTIHNMILGDRVVSRLKYDDAMAYAAFLARRLTQLYLELRPSVIIGGFDALHSCIALAVARHTNIPWFALNFSVIPPGFACFCDQMSPASRVQLTARLDSELRPLAEASLQQFESRNIQAHAFIALPPPSLLARIAALPAQALAMVRTLRYANERKFWRFTEGRGRYDVAAAVAHLRRTAHARRAIARTPALAEPPTTPYVLFGLHMQPESSIDVWAPFFSNQMWVIELLARSIPASHRLLVKIHKSDVAKYTVAELARMRTLPGVELVRPFADTRKFIEGADLIVAIQGTMGLEGALLGKPVIMLGDSPVTAFPTVSRIAEIAGLPRLIRAKLAEPSPSRSDIITAYASYLAPFFPASHNDWRIARSDEDIDRYVSLFERLRRHLLDRSVTPLRNAL